MDAVESRFYPCIDPTTGDHVGRMKALAISAIGLLGAAKLLAAGWGWWPPLIIVALIATFLPAAVRESWRAGVRVDARGLRLCYPFGFGRRLSWGVVEDVSADPQGLTLHLSGGRHRRVIGELGNWLELDGHCRRALGQEPRPDLGDGEKVADVPPEEVAKWLRIGPDGALTCTSGLYRWLPLTVPPALLLAAVLPWDKWAAAPKGSTLSYVGGMCLMVMMAPIALALSVYTGAAGRRGARLREVRATPTELDVRTDFGWHRYAWGGIHGVVERLGFAQVTTVDGDLWLPFDLTHDDRLLSALRAAIDARRRGMALPPAPAEVSDAALSRAGEAELSVERGLSVVEDVTEG
jgi:hypothetical protein